MDRYHYARESIVSRLNITTGNRAREMAAQPGNAPIALRMLIVQLGRNAQKKNTHTQTRRVREIACDSRV